MAAFVTCQMTYAQSSPTTVSYNKSDQPALMIELPYTEDVSQGFIVTNLKKTGYEPETKGSLFWKNNKINGYYTYKGVRLQGAGEPLDLYFKVEPKSRKQKDKSIIYLLVNKGSDGFLNSGSDYNAAQQFLNGFLEQSAGYKLDLDIKAQENNLKEAQKRLTKLQDDEKSINTKIDQLQTDLKKNQQDQENQQKTIEAEQKKLEELKTGKSS